MPVIHGHGIKFVPAPIHAVEGKPCSIAGPPLYSPDVRELEPVFVGRAAAALGSHSFAGRPSFSGDRQAPVRVGWLYGDQEALTAARLMLSEDLRQTRLTIISSSQGGGVGGEGRIFVRHASMGH